MFVIRERLYAHPVLHILDTEGYFLGTSVYEPTKLMLVH